MPSIPQLPVRISYKQLRTAPVVLTLTQTPTNIHPLFVQANLASFLIRPGLQTANADFICDIATETKLSRQNREQQIDTKTLQVLRQKYSRETAGASRGVQKK